MDNKVKIRSRKKWKDFRQNMIKEHNYTCQMCGTSYVGKRKRMLNIHHLDESLINYQNLDPERYRVLCASCHELVEKMIVRIENNKLPDYIGFAWELLFSVLDLMKYRPYKENYIPINKNNQYGLIDVYKLEKNKSQYIENIKNN